MCSARGSICCRDSYEHRIVLAPNNISAEINRAGDKEVVFTFKNRATRKFTGRSLLLMFSVPQFFLHVTTAYDILRHAGVDLAKDFLGPARQA